ncbi:HTH-type transcriptional regulator CdhR [Paraburkholderia aspalathi]|uniref:HTH-type transcriptional regulator CdhR n=1 Tax=Paraburkholderia aspalathi TaxID=1324617 RepID=A0ABN7LSY2_9BURK|nr:MULTISPECIES: GlxA family transcriptional regulator [Paraburkholderia]MBK3743821.1 GlxA family transcriptional regulator [Paraburkholderia aspalathi]MBK3819685.1 GlxA family transcriptional regulator [Paraburkholderia aspalathi]MBK3831565.1 GlxA family transcriptional regulator [Paraburkholderia aspalathi]MBK3861345.1 GlxA family transcriptional regulator [Paraburkholderia aspalathi]CAE6759704.1 HTH-type transcriptional regulator CdhR [Paraburkholderia aspalathi]
MKRVGVVVFPGFQILDMVAISVFELANLEGGQPEYEVEVISEQGGMVRSSAGVEVATKSFGDPAYDTVVVTGAMQIEPSSAGLLGFLNDALAASRRTTSICTGAFVLAEAGILDGRHATTHWFHARDLQQRFPDTRIDEDRIFIVDGTVWTSAGMTACIDLCLALVESDLGVEVSRAIAKKLVVYHRRTGGQSQFSAMLDLEPKSDRIQDALSYAKNHLREPLTVEQLADVAHLSPRQFSRAFRDETRQSPAKAIEALRVEAARAMLEAGRHSMEAVAAETGFIDTERMRRAFLRAFGQPPQAIKRAARAM